MVECLFSSQINFCFTPNQKSVFCENENYHNFISFRLFTIC
jgi:hypothetical protein